MMKILTFVIGLVDCLIAVPLFFIVFFLMFIWRRFFLLRDTLDNKTILFLSSGKPIKDPKFDDEKYEREWHDYFQKQFLRPGYKKTIVTYSGCYKSETYKFTDNVDAIVQRLLKEYKCIKRTVRIINLFKRCVFNINLIKKNKISLLCVYVPSDRQFLASIIKFFTGIPLLALVMGNSDLSRSEPTFEYGKLKSLIIYIVDKIIMTLFFYQANCVIAYNNHCGDFALCNGADANKIRRTRIYPCIKEIDESKLINKVELKNFPKTKQVIIMWSRFSAEKKIPFALLGAFEVLKHNSNVGLCVIGYGPMYLEIENLIEKSGVKERVSLIGFTPSHELISYIYHSDVALIPLGGFSMLEACLLKKPIVCFDIEWHHELLTDGYSAYFADYPSSQQVCEKLLEALDDPDEASKRGKRACERYLMLFNEDKIMQRDEQIMKEFSGNFGLKNSFKSKV